MAAVDLNHDGKSDLVRSQFLHPQSQIVHSGRCCLRTPWQGQRYLQSSSDSWRRRPWTVFVAVADGNGDEKPDIAVINELTHYYHANNGVASVLLNTFPWSGS